MLKRVISVLLALGLLFGVHAMAVNAVDTEGAPSAPAERTMPADFDPSMIPQGDFDPSKMPQGEFDPSKMPQGEFKPPNGGQMPAEMGGFPGNVQPNKQNASAEQSVGFLGFVKTYSTPITSVILLGLAYLFVIFYKRKHY